MDVREKSLNEKRLIDANALKRVLLPITSALEHEYGSLGGAVSGVIKHIDSAPTIDAVPVIRCRECEHHYWEQEPCHGKTVHYCNLPHMSGVQVFKEFFCYYGERKEGAN